LEKKLARTEENAPDFGYSVEGTPERERLPTKLVRR
jgi:hypothetical protein